jgi:hypothetical protein
MLPSSPPEALSFAMPREKEMSSFEKVLVSNGKGMSGNITESKK